MAFSVFQHVKHLRAQNDPHFPIYGVHVCIRVWVYI